MQTLAPIQTDYTVIFLLSDEKQRPSYTDTRVTANSKQDALELVKDDIVSKFKNMTINGVCVTPTALFAA